MAKYPINANGINWDEIQRYCAKKYCSSDLWEIYFSGKEIHKRDLEYRDSRSCRHVCLSIDNGSEENWREMMICIFVSYLPFNW